MADNNGKGYIIDVAKRHKYYNQSREYQKKYQQWRTAKNNPYGYNFVRDSREHAYVDGEGFIDNTGIDEEKNVLLNCFRLLGVAMLIMAAVCVVKIIVMKILFGYDNGGRMYYSMVDSKSALSIQAAYTLTILNLLEYFLPLFFLNATTHLPLKVAIPIKRTKMSVLLSVVLVMMLLLAVGRLVNMFMSVALSKLSIDSLYYDYIVVDDPATMLVCGLLQHVVLSVLIEIFYRGYLLQLFRQFGDMFAVLLTSVVSVWMLQDLTQIGYLFIVSFFTGLVTVRTGSIFPACIMRVSARLIAFAITLVHFGVSDAYGEVFELVIMIAVFFGSVFYYKRMGRKSFRLAIGKDSTDMTLRAKFRMMILSAPVWCGFLAMLVLCILTVRIL
ncbi:MAG: CPBP family intramembrane metalloprotease [Ruminococcus sp.]|nr:CPBP family intramembrane metalloprotease [Ruminococcus sp.]